VKKCFAPFLLFLSDIVMRKITNTSLQAQRAEEREFSGAWKKRTACLKGSSDFDGGTTRLWHSLLGRLQETRNPRPCPPTL
jgi:hypothetical protein